MKIKSSPFVKRIVSATFPEYRGRKFQISDTKSESMRLVSYWDGGSKYEYRVYHLNGPVSTPPSIHSPFETAKFTVEEMAKDNYQIVPGEILVEHIFFCGKDLGCRFYVHPTDMILFSDTV